MAEFQVPAGMVACTTFGSVTSETAQAWGDMRARAMEINLKNVLFQYVHGVLVDKARNEAVRQMLAHQNPKFEWLCYFDGDMLFDPRILEMLLATAYNDAKWADVIGGYCQLRGEPYLPTIDTGTGTWESWDANVGLAEVIRTGGACLLVKRHVFERMEYPWFGVRPVPRALDIMAELDNFARCKLDGKNPFAHMTEWQALLKAAAEDASRNRQVTDNTPGWEYSTVGEDSNFCDRSKALGFRIVVNTHAVCGHVDKKVIWPKDHIEAMKKMAQQRRLVAGITNGS